jgi:hypothetical protein
MSTISVKPTVYPRCHRGERRGLDVTVASGVPDSVACESQSSSIRKRM